MLSGILLPFVKCLESDFSVCICPPTIMCVCIQKPKLVGDVTKDRAQTESSNIKPC